MPDARTVLDFKGPAEVETPEHTEAWSLPGFGPDVRIETNLGPVPAALLRRGDLVVVPSGQYTQIEWIDRIGLDAQFLAARPAARPRRLPKGCGPSGIPHADLLLSGAQTLLWGTREGQMIACAELSASALHPAEAIKYTVFHCEDPVLVCAEGLWCLVDPATSTEGRAVG
ncbi:MAG: Hint domain-containing protein [Pseudomonadota bacterium]